MERRYPWMGMRVLIADDVMVGVDMLRNMLVSLGLVVDVVYRGDDALHRLLSNDEELMAAGGYALAFLDVFMPGMGGLEVAMKFRESKQFNAQTLPIIGMSSDSEPILVERAHASGMNVLLLKPVVRKMLEDLLGNLFVADKVSTASELSGDGLGVIERESRSMFTLARTLLGAKRLMEDVLDGIPCPCYLKNAADQRYQRVNKAFAKMFNLDRQSVIGCRSSDLFHPNTVKLLAKHNQKTLVARGSVDFIDELEIQGRCRIIKKTQTLIESDDGRRFILGFAEDVTERIAGEKLLAAHLNKEIRGIQNRLKAIMKAVDHIREDGKAGTRRANADLIEDAVAGVQKSLDGLAREVKEGEGGRK